LFSVQGISLNEIEAILPVDHYVVGDFFNRIKDLEEIVLSSGLDLALIGVGPTYPSSKKGNDVPVTNLVITNA